VTPIVQGGRMLESLSIQNLAGLDALVELVLAFPSNDCFPASISPASRGVEFDVFCLGALAVFECGWMNVGFQSVQTGSIR